MTGDGPAEWFQASYAVSCEFADAPRAALTSRRGKKALALRLQPSGTARLGNGTAYIEDKAAARTKCLR